jgi:hypothetical protein
MSEIQSSPMDPEMTVDEAGRAHADRAAAHTMDESVLRTAQRFQHGVTDLQVARVMYALERGTRPYRNRVGRWYAPTGSPISGMGANLSSIIGEMVRTGLVRHWKDREGDHLIPAPVHYRVRDTDYPGLIQAHSACLFVGEDMGPMRSRLTDRLDLTDCLACESVVATGHVRRL